MPLQHYDVEGERLRFYPLTTSEKASVLWGGRNSHIFQQRVSRAIYSLDMREISRMYSLRERPENRYELVAKGILGRNKGLRPKAILFRDEYKSPGVNVDLSPYDPRPSKTSIKKRSESMAAEYGGLGQSFVNAAVELALLLQDIDDAISVIWLRREMEQQDLAWSWTVAREEESETGGAGMASYCLQYVVMLTGLNCGTKSVDAQGLIRPELTVGLVWTILQLGENEVVRCSKFPRATASMPLAATFIGPSSLAQCYLKFIDRTRGTLLRSRGWLERHYVQQSTVRIIGYYLGHDVSEAEALQVTRVLKHVMIGESNLTSQGMKLYS
eukprot:Plantae.Rhodophyta-Rhodochaete_pulchella.ctg20138.p1 GENE.Plantae.Rhodophyta-Rhodochaete_pulchella.ctg20138~~Plantae.Rhodophyta-Rhodochaete_pulchella.ctg20138.p1  ORF type:complete len:328 (+),score=26.37 Plantae.Rhodophyta-Rhodochaete_pulchella.ctg20138:193-1176(+)